MSNENESDQKEQLVLFTTVGCHLCEQAKAVYDNVLNPAYFQLEERDIADSDAMIEQYGVRIPVIQHESSGKELNWPFTEQELVDFLTPLLSVVPSED